VTTSTKLLIANRGEIACRIIRACHALGIGAVAVHSTADAAALHVEMADESVEIGAPPPRESYLDIERIIAAAITSGATCVHPGYGFLSESEPFAKAVLEAGLIWVGPSPDSLRDMGNKGRARGIAQAVGVPVLPASRIIGPDQGDLGAEAGKIGYPLLIKAVSGGGGIGMKRVDEPNRLDTAAETTRSMAAKAFGDSSIYLERLVDRARHIEVQIFGFGDGTGVHLFERDCSIQRRYQKIVEEAGALDLPSHVLESMREAAMALVRAQRYSGAGTIEFIYDVDAETAYFLEMNTRIQVEHPVTEMITGRDLVAWQIQHALGDTPDVTQNDIGAEGHAIEVRLCAERPEKNFLPSPAMFETVRWPDEQPWLRIDAGLRAGDRISPYYDSMIAKLIVSGPTRQDAVQRLRHALGGTDFGEARSNLAFLRALASSDDFYIGGATTRFLQDWLPQWIGGAH
jgi:3-methylcrotonyl-CoA carboxylase alpha subunit